MSDRIEDVIACDPDKDCNCAALSDDPRYGMAMHVASIFIILAVSLLGSFLPIVSKKVPSLKVNNMVLEALMVFGFGVVISTGFIHMLADGIERLNDPCLGVVDKYGSLGLAITLTTILAMHLIECEFASFTTRLADRQTPNAADEEFEGLPPHGRFSADENNVYALQSKNSHDVNHGNHGHAHGAAACITTKLSWQTQVSVLLFELGVVLHSVIIGVDLGTTSDNNFTSLLIALCFHQFFEGVAVGSTALEAFEGWGRLMVIAVGYSMTTPIGIAIGISVRQTYSAKSSTSLWVGGILNCIAGGILLYTGIVELLTYQLTVNKEFQHKGCGKRFFIYGSLWLGAGSMTLLGKWA